MMRQFLVLPLLACGPAAQELLWQVTSQQDIYGLAGAIGDLNDDGRVDLMAPTWVSYLTTNDLRLRILSGADGAILQSVPLPYRTFYLREVGDFDRDGYLDYAVSWDDGIAQTNYVEVWSPRRNQQLLFLSAPAADGFGGVLAGRVDLDGDGLPDLVIGSTRPFTGDVRGYRHDGTMLYRIPVGNAVVLDVLGLPDLDGDGRSEFVVGGVDYTLGYSRGFVALRSGLSGALIRIGYDQQPGDLIGKPLCAVGDMDRDGVQDYATGNYWTTSGRSLVTVYSGATGSVIREWTATAFGFSGALGGSDADLDGFVDLIAGLPDQPNGPGLARGRVNVFSSRDQQVLLHTQPQTTNSAGQYGASLASLGVQPGNPYPVFAVWDLTVLGHGRIEVWRCNPPAVRITGTGCSSAGGDPTIGVRRVATPSGEQSRIVLGSAPSNAFVWCVVAPTSANSFAGLSLPIALDPLGYRGCNLYVPATVSVARTVGSSGFDRGYAEVHLPRPLVATGGYHAAAQWLVLDPATLGHAMTPRCEFRVQ